MGRTRLPATRFGSTHTIRVGAMNLYITVNLGADGTPMEVFVKCDEGWTGWCEALAVTMSMALQHGCPFDDILKKWRGMRFEPAGIKAFSIPDAIAREFLIEEKQP